MSTPRRRLPKAVLTDEEAAQRAYERAISTTPAKEITPLGVARDLAGAHEDSSDLRNFPERLRGRLEQYIPRGPDLNNPAFTYPINHSEVTPYRAQYDLQLAQDAAVDWLKQGAEPPNNRSRRSRLSMRNPAQGKSK